MLTDKREKKEHSLHKSRPVWLPCFSSILLFFTLNPFYGNGTEWQTAHYLKEDKEMVMEWVFIFVWMSVRKGMSYKRINSEEPGGYKERKTGADKKKKWRSEEKS